MKRVGHMMRRLPLAVFAAGCSLSALAETAAEAEPAAAAGRQAAGFAASSGSGAGYLAQLVVGLMVVVAGILVLAWFLRRMNLVNSGAGGALRVLGGVSVGQRERVVLLQVGGQQMLVGVAPGSVRLIRELDEPVALDRGRERDAGGGFSRQLAAALAGRKTGGDA